MDPVKDTVAAKNEIDMGINSRTIIAAKKGRQIIDVFDDLERENQLAKDRKIDITGGSGANAVIDDEDDDDDGTAVRRMGATLVGTNGKGAVHG